MTFSASLWLLTSSYLVYQRRDRISLQLRPVNWMLSNRLLVVNCGIIIEILRRKDMDLECW
jgi:hypothetical protein